MHPVRAHPKFEVSRLLSTCLQCSGEACSMGRGLHRSIAQELLWGKRRCRVVWSNFWPCHGVWHFWWSWWSSWSWGPGHVTWPYIYMYHYIILYTIFCDILNVYHFLSSFINEYQWYSMWMYVDLRWSMCICDILWSSMRFCDLLCVSFWFWCKFEHRSMVWQWCFLWNDCSWAKGV